MITITSNKIRNFRFLTLRCGFFSIEYQSNSIHEKIIENMKEKSNRKIVEKNMKIDNRKLNGNNIIEKKNMKIDNRKLNGSNIIEKKNMKIDNRKLNGNCKCEQKKIKLDRMKIGLNIIEQIVRIGSALSGLLPSMRHVLLLHTLTRF
ncbi:MAG: hypothetical protein IIA83_01630 [Thaumarchaeota archaeon]|nr:hypothetical protein [Nitrososphaerota archaeon]